ncbi:hypothetical protein ACWCOW_33665 [Streptomyces sp. NPDC001939]
MQALQEGFGPPREASGARNQHTEYDAVWKAWQDAALNVHTAIGRDESGSRRCGRRDIAPAANAAWRRAQTGTQLAQKRFAGPDLPDREKSSP